jgi:hypothetical protein
VHPEIVTRWPVEYPCAKLVVTVARVAPAVAFVIEETLCDTCGTLVIVICPLYPDGLAPEIKTICPS